MGITHILVGVLIALPFGILMPEQAITLFVIGAIGGIFPDFDLYVGHRKTLHYPVYYGGFVVLLGAMVVLTLEFVIILGFIFASAAWLHSVMDIFGSGLELRPWEGTSERAVFNHWREGWIKPRRIISYDGSPGDLCLSAVLAVPLLVVYSSPLQKYVGLLLIIGIAYAVLRKQLAEIASGIAGRLPSKIHAFVPARYFD